MAFVVKDRVRETTTIAGTGTVTLLGAFTGYQTFSVIGDGNSTYYTISSAGSTEWEVGIGTYTLSGTTLTRSTVIASSNSGSLVSFSAGTKDIYCVGPSSKLFVLDSSGNFNMGSGTFTATTGTFTTINGQVATATQSSITSIPNLATVGTIVSGIWHGSTIADTYLQTISTAGKVSNSATTAVSTNTGSTIVLRDGSGNFSAGTITAALSGNASTVTNGVVTTGSYSDPAWITGLAGSKISGNISGQAGTVVGYSSEEGTRSSTDWNTRLSTGFFNAAASPTNSVGSYASLIVAHGVDTGLQIAGGYNNDQLWFRGWYSSGAGFTSWRTILHNGNYNSYSPTLTGGGASGTWGIDITGNSATTSQRTFSYLRTDGINTGSWGTVTISGTSGGYSGINFDTAGVTLMINTGALGFYRIGTGWAFYIDGSNVINVATIPGGQVTGSIPGNAANINNYSINQNLATSSGPTFVDVYNNGGWFRNTGDLGMYSTTYGVYFYPSSAAYWNMASATSNGALVMRQGYASTIKGYLYWDSSGFGLLHSGGGWAVMVAPGGGTGTLTGTWTTSGDHYANNYYTSSSRKLKHDIKAFDEDALLILDGVAIKTYVLNARPGIRRVGFIAEDTNPWLSGMEQKHFDYGNSIALLIRSVQQLKARIVELEYARQ
jgi:hypothetical protein